jgi:hypothetical protein
MAHYDGKLLKACATGPLTSVEIGKIVGCYGVDAVTRLRGQKDLRVTIVGHLFGDDHRGPSRKLYRVEKIGHVSRAYCCGYCEKQRQINAQVLASST